MKMILPAAKNRVAGFTLIELLIVIAIIGLLAGMLMVASSQAQRRSHKTHAQTEVRELAKAWKSYWMIFEEWPASVAGTDQEMTGDVMKSLQGINPQGIKFMDLGRDVSQEGFKDVWGNRYKMDFSDASSMGYDYYETTVFLRNNKRYEYE